MNQLLRNKLIFQATTIFIAWYLLLQLAARIATTIIPDTGQFVAVNRFANFDGLHYLNIASGGYGLYQQAFFPLFPLLIRLSNDLIHLSDMTSGFLIAYLSSIASIYFLYKLIALDFSGKTAFWGVVFLLAFPTSFFLVSVYTESLFLFLTLVSFYAARKKKWLIAGIAGALASATRFVGILLLPALIIEVIQTYHTGSFDQRLRTLFKKAWGVLLVPLGLISYMLFLLQFFQDSLAFIHVQSAFGANRSNEEIILLPQVLFRYIKIFLTVSYSSFPFWIAAFEVGTFLFVVISLIILKKAWRLSYLVFSFGAILLPTLSGTLSSMPRYVLIVFPLFIALATIRSAVVRIVFLSVFSILLILSMGYFLQGYFVG